MEPLRPKIAVNTVVIRNQTLLLGKRKNTAGDGDWGLPGGHLEYSESLADAAKRELREETGLIADQLSLLHVINDPRVEDNTHYIHVDFLVITPKGEATVMEPDKCYEWKWFPLDALPSNIFIGHQKSIAHISSKVKLFDYRLGNEAPLQFS